MTSVLDRLPFCGVMNHCLRWQNTSSGISRPLLESKCLSWCSEGSTPTSCWRELNNIGLWWCQEHRWSRRERERERERDAWRAKNLQRFLTFTFYDFILQMEKLLFIFVGAHKKKNLDFYIFCLQALVLIFRSLMHMIYSYHPQGYHPQHKQQLARSTTKKHLLLSNISVLFRCVCTRWSH